jgi:hypothetical protein
MTHRAAPPKQYRRAGHLLGPSGGSCSAALATLVIALAACGSPPRPDHGSYSSTGAETTATVKPYAFPRAKRLAIASPTARFPCVRDWAEQHLQGKGIISAAPVALDSGFVATRLVRPGALSADELAALDGMLVLAIAVDSLEGPGGGWNPWSGAITSSLERSDLALAIYEPGNTTALWRSQSRVRAALKCPDSELKAQLQQLLAHIQ